MADTTQTAEQQAAAREAMAATGGMMQGESPPFDDTATNQPNEIAEIFGLGEEAGPVPNSSETQSDGGASPSGASPAAEGGEGQATKPATPPAPSQTEAGQQGETQAPAQQQPAAPAAPSATPAPTQAAAPQPSVEALTAQVQALIAHTTELQRRLAEGAGTTAPQPGPGEQQGQQPADPYMDYRLAIPDDVANAIFNEDPQIAKQGISHLINSLGRIVHERVLRSVNEHVLPQRLQEFQGNLTLTQQQEQMRQEYYRDFPQHNDPGIKLIVAQEAQAMWAVNPTLQWDENARRALGARVNARLGQPVVTAALGQQQQQDPPANPAPRPAAQMGASTRPAQTFDEGNFIMDTLSAGG